ncbi:MAG: tRNA (guanosine(46)-N7)-methyltransferase TrmB [Gammaproteobacteria bacterium]|nr:tRNA (guanosine(46)-N7)-methyltransferase TrmB [Gammaproteobacteria bacterium]
MSEQSKQRRIRSFVRREGRLTRGQQRALDELFPSMGIEQSDQPLDLDAVFGRTAPRILEIGFGNGGALASMAASQPQKDFIGIEVHRPGVGNLLLQVEKQGLTNVRVICADAVEVIRDMLPEQSLDGVCLFFPDPWHKKRHHKRRILQAGFVQLLRSRLKLAATFHMATDWQDYAEQMLEVMDSTEGFSNTAGTGQYVPRPETRPLTKFEQRGQRLGHGVWDLIFIRNA